ncbi:hypothetical protein RYX36_007211 [Vicia faba]
MKFGKSLNNQIEKTTPQWRDKFLSYKLLKKKLKLPPAADERHNKRARVHDGNGSNEQMIKIHKDIVDFHGEMVLLKNYNALNYTGLVKILKKYDKRTGALIRLPFIQKEIRSGSSTVSMFSLPPLEQTLNNISVLEQTAK